MKSLVYIAIFLFSLTAFAQKPKTKPMKPRFNTEQQAELNSKRMVLALDLNEKQQKQVKALELAKAKEREAHRKQREARQKSGEKPSQDELFEMQSKRLDAQIAHQKEMKKILTEEQFVKWQEINKQRMQRMSKRMHHKNKQGMKKNFPDQP